MEDQVSQVSMDLVVVARDTIGTPCRGKWVHVWVRQTQTQKNILKQRELWIRNDIFYERFPIAGA